MKKIFIIIASCLMFFIFILLITTNFIFVTDKIHTKNPDSINIYKKSVASLNNKTYTSKDTEFEEIINKINSIGKLSVFERLINNIDANEKIEQSRDDEYTENVSDVKKNNICVEFLYDFKQDKIIYVGAETKVISYDKLLFVFSNTKDIDTILVYYADGTNGYEKFNPLLLNGKNKNIINYINSL